MLNPCTDEFAERLAANIAGLTVKPAEARFLEEPRGKYFGQPTFVAMPRNTDDVAAIVKAAAHARVGLQPYGGGTGLVGGQLSDAGPAALIVAFEKMNAIRAIHPEEFSLVAEAGATLAAIHDAAAAHDRLFPLSYASQGTAQIGAGLAVNSGGLNVLRYGMARDLCLGVEAVLASGEVFHGLKRLRKDNTGYDLRHLLIGAEGTLGIITAASLALSPVPQRTGTAFLVTPGPDEALALLSILRAAAGETISAFEIMSREGFDFLAETHPDVRQPFGDSPDWALLIELGTPEGLDPDAILEEVFAAALEKSLVSDGLIATSGAQRQEFWAVREMIPEANRAIGAIASHDVSLPLSELADFVAETRLEISKISDEVRVNAFGHLGDGNLHYNVFPPKGRPAKEYRNLAPAITELVHEAVVSRGGSFSAEHGIGRLKTADLTRYGDPAKLSAMNALKTALDPLGILNPGVVLDR